MYGPEVYTRNNDLSTVTVQWKVGNMVLPDTLS